MIKTKSKAGLVVYEVTAEDIKKLGGHGICDHCNNYAKNGFLVAILNSYLCPSCYQKWDNQSQRYEEDIPIEKRREEYYDKVFGLIPEDAQQCTVDCVKHTFLPDGKIDSKKLPCNIKASQNNNTISFFPQEDSKIGITIRLNELLDLILDPMLSEDGLDGFEGDEQQCRVCGCTWYTPCEGGCSWVEKDLCSKCAEKEADKKAETPG